MLITERRGEKKHVRPLPKIPEGIWGTIEQDAGFLDENPVSDCPFSLSAEIALCQI